MRKNTIVTAAAGLLLMSTLTSFAGEQLSATRTVGAPPGFANACAKFSWLCSNSGHAKLAKSSSMTLLKKVNSSVNASVRPAKDKARFGRREVWSLPTDGRGDCEDYVLMKHKRLVEAGFPSNSLALSVVLDRKGQNHMVLVARTESGDMVLDNLTSRIKPFNRTGYTFVARQDFDNKSKWRVSLAGPRADMLAKRL
jgi:predicted transglutaminase-like cysteine proteinase